MAENGVAKAETNPLEQWAVIEPEMSGQPLSGDDQVAYPAQRCSADVTGMHRGSTDTEKLFNDYRVRCFQSFQTVARRKLKILDDAKSLNDPAVLPGNTRLAMVLTPFICFSTDLEEIASILATVHH